jgi:hypothetical protein
MIGPNYQGQVRTKLRLHPSKRRIDWIAKKIDSATVRLSVSSCFTAARLSEEAIMKESTKLGNVVRAAGPS